MTSRQLNKLRIYECRRCEMQPTHTTRWRSTMLPSLRVTLQQQQKQHQKQKAPSYSLVGLIGTSSTIRNALRVALRKDPYYAPPLLCHNHSLSPFLSPKTMTMQTMTMQTMTMQTSSTYNTFPNSETRMNVQIKNYFTITSPVLQSLHSSSQSSPISVLNEETKTILSIKHGQFSLDTMHKAIEIMDIWLNMDSKEGIHHATKVFYKIINENKQVGNRNYHSRELSGGEWGEGTWGVGPIHGRDRFHALWEGTYGGY